MEKILRYPYERTSLVLSVLIAFFLSYFVIQVSSYLLFGLLIFQLVSILTQQKQIQGNSIKITEIQFKSLYDIIKKESEMLQIQLPDSFVNFDPEINAYVMGFKRPYTLVITSALVEAMDEEELKFIIGHELGHIKLGHSKFKSLVSPLNSNVPVLTYVFNQWLRKTEYSSDRAGLVLSGNPKFGIRALLKLTVGPKLYQNLNTKDIVDQIQTSFDEKLERFGELLLTHPYTTNRIKQLIEFRGLLKKNNAS